MGPASMKALMGAAMTLLVVGMVVLGMATWGSDGSANLAHPVSRANTNFMKVGAPLPPGVPCVCDAVCNCPADVICHCSCTCERPEEALERKAREQAEVLSPSASQSHVPAAVVVDDDVAPLTHPKSSSNKSDPPASTPTPTRTRTHSRSRTRTPSRSRTPTPTRSLDPTPSTSRDPSSTKTAARTAPAMSNDKPKRVIPLDAHTPTKSDPPASTPTPTRTQSALPSSTLMAVPQDGAVGQDSPVPPVVVSTDSQASTLPNKQSPTPDSTATPKSNSNSPDNPKSSKASKDASKDKKDWFSPYHFSSERGFRPENSTGPCDFSKCASPPYVYYVTSFRNRGAEYHRFLASAARDIASSQSVVSPDCVCASVADFNHVLYGPTSEAALADWPGPVSNLKVKGEFSRAGGLRLAVDAALSTPPEQSLLFFVDTDMIVFDGWLSRMVAMTVEGESMYCPIIWSTHGNKTDDVDGWWRLGGAGMVSVYMSDYLKIKEAQGSHPGEQRVSWGLEDQRFIEAVRLVRDLKLERTCSPELWHLFHQRGSWRHSLSGSPETLLKNMYLARHEKNQAAKAQGLEVKKKPAVPSSFQDDDTWQEREWQLPVPPPGHHLELYRRGLTTEKVCMVKHPKPFV